MKTREFAIVCAVVLVLAGLVSPIAAEKGDKQITFGVLYSMPTDDLVVGTQTTELDEALGFGASFEFQVTDLIGIEPGISSFSHDVTVVNPTAVGDTKLFAVTTNINFHFEKDSGLDLYFGPTVGYALWDDIKLAQFPAPAVAIPTDDEFMIGANFGLDYPFGGGGWSFNAGLSYLAVDVAPPALGDIGVSPIQVKAGLGYTF